MDLRTRLLSFNFPTHPSSSSNHQCLKSIYQIRFKKDKAKKLLAEPRVVLRIVSLIHEHTRRLHEIEVQLADEDEKIKSAIDELKRFRKVKEASTALKVVWQPEIICSRQKQIVENSSVLVDIRINALRWRLSFEEGLGKKVDGYSGNNLLWWRVGIEDTNEDTNAMKNDHMNRNPLNLLRQTTEKEKLHVLQVVDLTLAC
ncbi:hypothetical protein L1987_80449 [Smallanthus sonchifolius]|uniref:Uncharacterized protein n=1 Tax=Smallanthus sonchifolius TaxID=185202 RepID=A0ACB8YMM6_9ASTR|nr:hypothetical protein L1987_80449 [Smallanthus sonchifolius]